MRKSLILQLPDIVAHGHQQARQFLAGLEDRHHVSCRSRHLALSALGEAPHADTPRRNHLVCGNDLGVLAALLSGHNNLPHLRGRVKLICVDPCPSEPATRASANGTGVADMEHLAALTMRLLLMRALLADTGFICVRLAHDPTPCTRLLMDTVFGTENNARDMLWQTPPSQRMVSLVLRHGLVHVYTKHRRRVEPASPDRAVPSGQLPDPAAAMLHHLLTVTTAPGDTVVTFNAAPEIAAVASASARQWVIATPDATACDTLHQHLSMQRGPPFLRLALPALS